MRITGQVIQSFGYKPAAWWKDAIAQSVGNDFDDEAARKYLDSFVPPTIPMREAGPKWHSNITPEDDIERDNVAKVSAHMDELMRVPTIVAGAIMPDACPSDVKPGTIPVGGVVAAKEAIHPGMHSSDICCSMAATFFEGHPDPIAILDAGMKLSHFGGGGRALGRQIKPHSALMDRFAANPFLAPLQSMAIEHFATQGDGNHFFYVGRTRHMGGAIALVTHHGSRGPGAQLYKAGVACAEKFRRQLSPETPAHNAWIPSETKEGGDYWEALQVIREWTKANHYAVHDLIVDALGLKRGLRSWNEHNFVFRRSDGLFYHAKGATPAYSGYADDDCGLTFIPLNMAEPILITKGLDAPNGLGFSPHGAGRNFSRTAYMRARPAGMSDADMIAEQAPGIDVRYFCGVPDVSELPGAYKNAASMRRQIDEFGLATIVDTIEPIGNIMAGDWQRDAPWRKKKAARPDPTTP